LNYFVRNPEAFLTTTLIGNNIVNVLYATLMALFLVEPIILGFEGITGRIPTELTVMVIQTIIASILIMIFGEIVPKAIFRIQASRMITMLAVPQKICNWLFKPLIYVANKASNFIIHLVQPDAEATEQVLRRQDVEMIFKEIRDMGGSADLDKEDSEILSNVLELSSKRVKESMIPRTDIVAIEKNTSVDEVLKTFIASGFSKLPVYEENIDDIIGVVFAYDLFQSPSELTEIIRPIKLVPNSQKSKDLLSEFQKSNLSVAIVIDEYGGTAGMVTIEDLLEEVVGDIQDEYDTDEHIMKKLAPGTFIISGNVELDELKEKFPEIDLEEDVNEYETVAGFVISTLGRIPKVNEELHLEGYKFIISKATPSRIETVKIVKLYE
jgi:CBS domain containing-hemolysin-like protein